MHVFLFHGHILETRIILGFCLFNIKDLQIYCPPIFGGKGHCD